MTGQNLREALREAEDLGCTVRHIIRTGELTITPPWGGKWIRINMRRKDAPRSLTTLLGKIRRNNGQN